MGKPTITIEEIAFEMFPDELFRKDFQRELFGIYSGLTGAIACVKNPVQQFSKMGWLIIYRIAFSYEEDFALAFLEPFDFADGVIEVIPQKEPSLDYNNLLQKSGSVFLPAGVQLVSFKFFRRKIKFIDVRNKTLILRYVDCSPLVLEEAAKRFPKSGLITVEINKIFGSAQIVKPSSDYFPKLQKFTKKIQKILKEVELIENKTKSPSIN